MQLPENGMEGVDPDLEDDAVPTQTSFEVEEKEEKPPRDETESDEEDPENEEDQEDQENADPTQGDTDSDGDGYVTADESAFVGSDDDSAFIRFGSESELRSDVEDEPASNDDEEDEEHQRRRAFEEGRRVRWMQEFRLEAQKMLHWFPELAGCGDWNWVSGRSGGPETSTRCRPSTRLRSETTCPDGLWRAAASSMTRPLGVPHASRLRSAQAPRPSQFAQPLPRRGHVAATRGPAWRGARVIGRLTTWTNRRPA